MLNKYKVNNIFEIAKSKVNKYPFKTDCKEITLEYDKKTGKYKVNGEKKK
ncbi:MAG: hypothetical protein ACOCVF_01620 [bacterium]